MRSTHTYSVLEVSRSTFGEIKDKLLAANYDHAFSEDGNTIDLHGIAIQESSWKCGVCGEPSREPADGELIICQKCGGHGVVQVEI